MSNEIKLFKQNKTKDYLKTLNKAMSLKIYKENSEAKELFKKALKTAYDLAIKIDDKRELDEDKIVDLMNKLGQNEQYIALKNKGADALIEYGIKAGITLAEGYVGTEINIPEEVIDNIADKGGDGLVKIFDRLIARLKKFLQKKSQSYKKRHQTSSN